MGFVKLGAIGHKTNQKWDHKGRTQIIQIIASSGPDHLNSLQFQYLDQNRSVHVSSVIGSPCFPGGIFKTFTFGGSHEYIKKVEGLYNRSQSGSNSRGIVKLRIHTNVKEYVICDIKVKSKSAELQSFSFNFGRMNQFGGFHGYHDSSSKVSSIGIYFKHLTVPPPSYLLRKPIKTKTKPVTPPSNLKFGFFSFAHN